MPPAGALDLLDTLLVTRVWSWVHNQIPGPPVAFIQRQCTFLCVLDPRHQSVWRDPVRGGRIGSGEGNGARVALPTPDGSVT